MIGYVVRGLLSRLRAEAALYLLTLASVALGVASVVAIQILHKSAIASFAAGMRAIDSDVDLSIVPAGPSLDESVWRVALADPDLEAALPVLEVTVKVRSEQRIYLDVFATDLTYAASLPWDGEPPELTTIFARPNFVAVTKAMARKLGVGIGDRVVVSLGSSVVELEVGGLLDLDRRSRLAGDRIAVVDIAFAQDAFGRIGEIDRVDLRYLEGADLARARSRLEAALPPGARQLTPKQREAQAEGLLAAFRVNLTALSFVSVLVGMFLVFSAVRAQVVRRREEFGLLRALGATRRSVVALASWEVAIIAALGCLLGIPLGFEAAERNVAAVSGTLQNLYLLDAIARLEPPPWLVPLALLVGIGGALLAAAPPLLEIAKSDPRVLLSARVVDRRIDRFAPRLAGAGIAVLGIAFASYFAFGVGARASGFLLGVAVLAALPLLLPFVFTRAFARLGSGGFSVGYAARALSRRVSTAVVAAAALASAVSMLFGITLMVGSFRDTVMNWITNAIRADVYVATETFSQSQGDAGIDATIVSRFENDPNVIAIDRQRKDSIWVGERRVTLLGIDATLPGGEVRFPLVGSADESAIARELAAGGAALVSEPFAIKAGIEVGEMLDLPGRDPSSPWRVEVLGIYRDYTSEHGIVVVDLAEYARGLGDGPINSLGLYVRPESDVESLVDEWREELPPSLTFTPNERLRSEALRIFDQTFLVTRLLEATALLVAALGLALALLILAAERRAEIALYRSLGATRRQVFGLFLGKGLAIAGAGLSLGAFGGLLLAFVLVHAINRAWFGWTIELTLPGLAIARQTLTILAAVGIASLYPAWIAAKESGADLSRDRE